MGISYKQNALCSRPPFLSPFGVIGRTSKCRGNCCPYNWRNHSLSHNGVSPCRSEAAWSERRPSFGQQQCFRRIFCAMATNQVKVQSLSALSSVVKEFPGKFADASKFGALMKDVGKCEARYKCDLQVGKMVDTL